MGKTSRKMYTPEFKAQMVIKALKEYEVLERAMQAHGAPEIINSDLGTVPGQPLDRALLEDH